MRRFLEGAGQLGQDLLAVDWDATPIGDPDDWPPALRNSVRILLTSKFSMWMAWGSELTFFCNDAYRWDTLGSKYPWALGRPAAEVWSEVWPDIGPRIDHVMRTGEATWDESLLLFLERSGYVEESYHTFSYSPLADDENRIAGMLCVVKEDTEQVISARRMMTLRDLGIRRSELTEDETIASVTRTLAGNPQSLPFALIYRFEPDGMTATLAGTTGFTNAGHPAAPPAMEVGDPDAAWPVDRLALGETVLLRGLDSRFSGLPCGSWPEPPTDALAVPLVQHRQRPYGFIVVGLNRYCLLTESYRGFIELIAGHLTSAIVDARSFEFEKQRAETLARIDRAKTDFFTNVSHEFRTPLTLLLGPAEDALADADSPLPPRQHGRMEVIHRNGQRLLKLVNSLLDFSRLESGKATAHYEPVDLARYTRELASMFDSAADRVGLDLTLDCEPMSTRPFVDPDHWAKILLNLLSNALKFTFEGGVTVRLREVDGHAVLTVRDTGIGIPENELPHLFERFHRVHGARSRSHEGSGIGLALVAELVALHGGTITAESKPGDGTTFTVRVPLGRTHLPAGQVVDAPTERPVETEPVARQAHELVTETLRWIDRGPRGSGVPSAPGGEAPTSSDRDEERTEEKRPRVLVVDDNVDMREYIAGLLAEDYDVVTAADGLEALEEIRAEAPDLVLTDVMMPRLDGFGLLEAIQADPTITNLPVVMLSARAGEEGTIEGLEAGADDYLVKPFSARELLARVRVNLELDKVRRIRGTLERSQELLDQAQRLAKVGSWEVDLTQDSISASPELLRLLDRSREEVKALGYRGFVEQLVHPADRTAVQTALEDASPGSLISYEARVVLPSGQERLVTVRGEPVEADDTGSPRVLRGSVQDITELREAEEAVATAKALERAVEREHAIADELQRSLLPERSFDLEHLDVATFYRPGVQGTQVGGDWYDIIELGAGRTALVVGDVMGRGVSAAAAMGQLRSAVRAFAKLDLAPAEVLEYLDSIVQDMEVDQIVTCVYAVFDSTDQTLRYANAGHLPPVLLTSDGRTERLIAPGPPLGAGYFETYTEQVHLQQGSTVVFYTDGLVERRDRDIDVGVDLLSAILERHGAEPLRELPQRLVDELLTTGQDDDVAILLARVNAEPFEAAVSHRLSVDEPAVSNARQFVAAYLQEWQVPAGDIEEVVLMASELVTNAILHGRPPIDLRLRHTGNEVVLEVQDRAAYRPRRRRAADDDEHGRGLQIVSVLADRWGSRATGMGKSVWFSKNLADERVGADRIRS